MSKIVYIVKTKLHYYPPCISQIRMINDLGYDIEVLYGTSDSSALKLLKNDGIKCTKVGNIRNDNTVKIKKAVEWFKYRRAILKKMKKYDTSTTIFWFGTAESVLPLKGKLNNKRYVISLLELLDDNMLKIRLLKKIVKKALTITVCEETRGYIMRYWWNLNYLPYVFPNKPYNQITDRKHQPSIPTTKNIVEKIRNKKVILYQGIIQNSEEICEVAKALKTTNKDYILLLMGIDKYKSVDKIKKIYDKVIYVPYIPAPYHLEITSYAYIGITFYRNDSLNKAFCAPNKIYEYSGFGIPILANDIPGLKNTIGTAGAAECIEFKSDYILEAIEKIEASYNDYSQKAKEFFNSTDNKKTMKELLNNINNK